MKLLNYTDNSKKCLPKKILKSLKSIDPMQHSEPISIHSTYAGNMKTDTERQ